jgi:hypothetical protein
VGRGGGGGYGVHSPVREGEYVRATQSIRGGKCTCKRGSTLSNAEDYTVQFPRRRVHVHEQVGGESGSESERARARSRREREREREREEKEREVGVLCVLPPLTVLCIVSSPPRL